MTEFEKGDVVRFELNEEIIGLHMIGHVLEVHGDGEILTVTCTLGKRLFTNLTPTHEDMGT